MLSVVNTGEKNTYCVMDLKKWFEGAGYSFNAQLIPDRGAIPEQQELEKDFILYDQKMRMISDSELQDASARRSGSVNMTRSTEMNDDPTDIIIMLQAASGTKANFDAQIEILCDFADLVYENMSNAEIAVVVYGVNSASLLTSTYNTNNIWFKRAAVLKSSLKQVQFQNSAYACSLDNAVDKVLSDVPMRSGRSKFAFNCIYGGVSWSNQYLNKLRQLTGLGVCYSEVKLLSFVYNDSDFATALYQIISYSGGFNLYSTSGGSVDLYEKVSSQGTFHQITYQSMNMLNQQMIVLNAPLEKNGTTDTDNDGLTDWEEVDTQNPAITWRRDGSMMLPSFEEYMYANYPLIYYFANTFDLWDQNVHVNVLPVLTDPSNADTDGDGIIDPIDTAPLVKGLAGGVVGRLYIVSSNGHSYLAYESFINDRINVSDFNETFKNNEGTFIYNNAPYYDLQAKKFITISLFANNDSFTVFRNSIIDIILNDDPITEGGIKINQELYIYFYNQSDNQQPNKSINQLITLNDFNKLFASFKFHNYYSLWTHNCTRFAAISWNLVSSTKVIETTISSDLKGFIGQIYGSKEMPMWYIHRNS